MSAKGTDSNCILRVVRTTRNMQFESVFCRHIFIHSNRTLSSFYDQLAIVWLILQNLVANRKQ